jgi:hypothetical protein
MRNKILTIEALLTLPAVEVCNYNATGFSKVLEVQPYLDENECVKANFVVKSFGQVVCTVDQLTDAVVAYNKIQSI